MVVLLLETIWTSGLTERFFFFFGSWSVVSSDLTDLYFFLALLVLKEGRLVADRAVADALVGWIMFAVFAGLLLSS